MAYKLGLGSANVVQLGVQSDKDTPNLTSTIVLDCISFSYDASIGFITDPSITTASCEKSILPAGRMYKGSLKARLNIGTMTMNALGAILGTNAAGPPLTAVDGTPRWWTIKCNRGDYNTGVCEVISGAIFESLTVNCAAGTGDAGMAIIEMKFSASTLSIAGALTTPLVAEASVPAYFAIIDPTTISNGVNTIGSIGTWRPTSVSITYNRPIEAATMYLTSLTLDPPTASGPASCEWKWEGRLTDGAAITKVIGTMVPTQGLDVKFLNGTKYIRFTSAMTPANTACSAYSTAVDGYGAVTESISWRCGYNATDAGSLKAWAVVA